MTSTNLGKAPQVVRKAPASPKDGQSGGAAKTWDAVDEASWESFPASDPPSHWAGKDQQPQLADEEEDEEQRAETD